MIEIHSYSQKNPVLIFPKSGMEVAWLNKDRENGVERVKQHSLRAIRELQEWGGDIEPWISYIREQVCFSYDLWAAKKGYTRLRYKSIGVSIVFDNGNHIIFYGEPEKENL